MSLTANQIQCLLAVLALTRMKNGAASKDVAKLLGISRPSAHKALDVLMEKGLLDKEPYGAAKLTPLGIQTAERLEARQERLILLFSRTFGLTMDESSAAATALLSELKEESLNQLEVRSGSCAGIQIQD